jgi:hypothetical protein
MDCFITHIRALLASRAAMTDWDSTRPGRRLTSYAGTGRRLPFGRRRQLFRRMLTTLLQLITRHPPADYERAFIHDVEVKERIARHPWVERILLAGWLVIAAKCLVLIWAIAHWRVPFHPYWVIVPTILMAALGTAVYYWRD